jgi:NitT/TauT family transport system permease protein
MPELRILAMVLISAVVLSIWQWGYDLHASLPWPVPDLLDPYFVSKSSEIFQQFLILSCLKPKMGAINGWFNGDLAKCLARNENNLWIARAVTLKNIFFEFLTESRGLGHDGCGDRTDAGRRGAVGHNMAIAGLSVRWQQHNMVE